MFSHRFLPTKVAANVEIALLKDAVTALEQRLALLEADRYPMIKPLTGRLSLRERLDRLQAQSAQQDKSADRMASARLEEPVIMLSPARAPLRDRVQRVLGANAQDEKSFPTQNVARSA